MKTAKSARRRRHDNLAPATNVPEWKDSLKRDIKVGDAIVAAEGGRQGGALNLAVVTELIQFEDVVTDYSTKGPNGYGWAMKAWLSPKTRVVYFYKGEKDGLWKRSSGSSVLQYPERFMILPDSHFDADALAVVEAIRQGGGPTAWSRTNECTEDGVKHSDSCTFYQTGTCSRVGLKP